MQLTHQLRQRLDRLQDEYDRKCQSVWEDLLDEFCETHGLTNAEMQDLLEQVTRSPSRAEEATRPKPKPTAPPDSFRKNYHIDPKSLKRGSRR